MIKKKIRSEIISVALVILGTIILIVSIVVNKPKENLQEPTNYEYVPNSVIENNIPVISVSKKVVNPYFDSNVKIGKSYYDYESSKENQENSLIYHENTYIQNSGVDFICESIFDVVAVLDGTVTNIKEDELLGKIIEISHNNDIISIYQSLSEISVKKGDSITQGQLIGKSGTSKINKDLGNHLHFEFCIAGNIVNPLLYLDKEIKSE